MKTIKDLIKATDYLGAEIKLTYKRHHNQKTLLGALLTILAYIIVIFCAFRLIISYLDRTNVDVTVSSQVSRTYHEIDLSKDHFYPIFIPFDGRQDPIEHKDVKRYFNFVGYTFKLNLKLTNGIYKSTVNMTSAFAFIPCKDIKDEYYKVFYENQNDFVKKSIETTGLCPDVANFSLFRTKGGLSEPQSTFLKFLVIPCILRITPNCASLQELNGTSVLPIIPKFSFDPQNVTNPVSVKANLEEMVKITPGVNIRRDYLFLKTEIWDDLNENTFAKPFLKEQYYSADLEKTKTNFVDLVGEAEDYSVCTGLPGAFCAPYYEISIKSGLKTTVIKRKYAKAADVLGEIGGIQQMVFLAFGMILLVQARCARREMAEDAIGDLVEGKELSWRRGGLKGLRGAENERVVGFNKILPKSGTSLIDIQQFRSDLLNGERERGKIMEEMLEEGLDSMDFLRRLNELSLISETFIPEVFDKLIPYVTVNRYLKKKNREKGLKLAKMKGVSNHNNKERSKGTKTNVIAFRRGDLIGKQVELVQIAGSQRLNFMLKNLMLEFLQTHTQLEILSSSQVGNEEEQVMNFEPNHLPLQNPEKSKIIQKSDEKGSLEEEGEVPENITELNRKDQAEKFTSDKKKSKLVVRGRGSLKRSNMDITGVKELNPQENKDSSGRESNQNDKDANQSQFVGIAQKPKKLNLKHSIRRLSLKK